jgi:hypothetical protein
MYQVIKGSDKVLTLYVVDEFTQPVDLTGRTVTVDLPLVSGVVAKPATLVDAEAGIISISISDSDDLLVAQNIPLDVTSVNGGDVKIYRLPDGLAVWTPAY